MNQPIKRAQQRPGVQQQRRDILAAAVALFAPAGSSSVSVSAICQQAGVSRDTFYRCFNNKDVLIDTLYQTSVNDHVSRVMEMADLDYSNPRWVHDVVDSTLDSIMEQATVAQFLYIEAADPASPAYRVVNEAYDKVARKMQNWARSHYGEAPPLEYYRALLMAAQWLVHNAIHTGGGPGDIKRAKQACEALFLRAFAPAPAQ
ncbi:MAG: TetR/AcrR family transcriptional regulator [Pseudomonadota bacterium]